MRDFLLQHGEQDAESLLQDTLPVGKTLNATFQTGLQEQQYLRDTLQQFADEATATTQQLLETNPHLHIRIQVPEQPTKLWCSVVAASARPKKYAEVWLEYLFWVAYQNTDIIDLERIVVCKDTVIHFANHQCTASTRVFSP